MEKLSFDSVKLGDTLPEITRSVDQEAIWLNAAASLDYNPVHTDPEWCARTSHLGRGSTVAHGMMTMSFMATALSNWAYPVGGKIKSMESKFINPVPPGYVLTCGGRVIEKHFIGAGRNYMTIELYADNQEGLRCAVCRAEVILP